MVRPNETITAILEKAFDPSNAKVDAAVQKALAEAERYAAEEVEDNKKGMLSRMTSLFKRAS